MGAYPALVKLCYDWMPKKVADRQGREDSGDVECRVIFPFDKFEESAHIMGVASPVFWSMCMYQYQSVHSAYCLANGLKEDGGDPSRMTLTDLDKLKEAVGRD